VVEFAGLCFSPKSLRSHGNLPKEVGMKSTHMNRRELPYIYISIIEGDKAV
jgi:hypothetical protein